VAAARVVGQRDLAWLADAAPDDAVRLAAVARLDDQEALARLALSAQTAASGWLRSLA